MDSGASQSPCSDMLPVSVPAAYGIALVTLMALALMQRGQPASSTSCPARSSPAVALALWAQGAGLACLLDGQRLR